MILFVLSIFAFFGWTFLNVLIIIYAWKQRQRSRQASTAANFNASLWAESERLKMESDLENARLRGSLDTSQTNYIHMSNLARKAIRLSEEESALPQELRMPTDDSILNADNIE